MQGVGAGRRQSPLPQTSLDLFLRRPCLAEQKAPRGGGTRSGSGLRWHFHRPQQNHPTFGPLWGLMEQQLKQVIESVTRPQSSRSSSLGPGGSLVSISFMELAFGKQREGGRESPELQILQPRARAGDRVSRGGCEGASSPSPRRACDPES